MPGIWSDQRFVVAVGRAIGRKHFYPNTFVLLGAYVTSRKEREIGKYISYETEGSSSQAADKRDAFLDGLKALQRAPTEKQFAVAAQLLDDKWGPCYPSLMRYFKHEWLCQRATWGQNCRGVPSSVPRHSCAIGGTHSGMNVSKPHQ
ncbi:hypothetical protein FOL47_000524 [Perkinsus chesapeaki]|uniref:Uncharacterized protein n=1 Tax=Perkinsus chesapeaki TaxID=330153 RepID=A0A7J6KVX6_PERCH|nr:hypothetical protein FOL47_000524 [Perkinsus chesapeaki]